MSEQRREPLVSVITASYNALDGLKKTVASVAGQSFPSFEHIVIDGGSTDGTARYLESLGDTVRWVSEPDQGIGDALNKGVDMAQGKYVLVLQAEDRFCDPGSLGRARRFLEDGLDIVAFEVQLDQDRGTMRLRPTRPFGFLTNFKMTNPHQGMFCRRELFDRIGAFDPSFKISMDYDFLLRAMRSGASIRAVKEPLSIMPENGVSTQRDWGSVRARLHEDRRLQRQLASPFLRLCYALFWALYLPCKWLKTLLFHD